MLFLYGPRMRPLTTKNYYFYSIPPLYVNNNSLPRLSTVIRALVGKLYIAGENQRSSWEYVMIIYYTTYMI